MPTLSIVIPAYNEEDGITLILERVLDGIRYKVVCPYRGRLICTLVKRIKC